MSSWEGRGRTQLHHCARMVSQLVSNVFLSIRNINVNVKDDEWIDTIALCCRNGHVEIARLLLQNGADVNAKAMWLDSSPFCCMNGHVDILHLLVENGADLEAQRQ
jgi:ankyrin repeat protein